MENQIQLYEAFEKHQNILNIIEKALKSSNPRPLMFKNYRILKLVGKGGFAFVFQAVHEKQVAIKIIDVFEMNKRHRSPEQQQKLKKYLKTEEINMMKCRSANTLKCYESFENKNYKIFVIEFCNGGQLYREIRRNRALPEHDAIIILRQIILGITELHRNRIIHRDLKPQNILSHNGVYKIVDFGFSRQMPENVQQQRYTALGSKFTMAPQVAEQKEYGLKADIYSLGMIYFLMVYPEGQVVKRNYVAYDMEKKRKFVFKTIDKKKISSQSSDFLLKTITANVQQRMNWEQVLVHPIFSQQFERLPRKFIPYENEDFTKATIMALTFKNSPVKESSSKKSEQIQMTVKEQIASKLQLKSFNMDDECYDLINQELLQCRKAEYIINNFIIPLEQQDLLDFSRRGNIELLILLSNRCLLNISRARKNIRDNYGAQEEIVKSFERQTKKLYDKTKQKWNQFGSVMKQGNQTIKSIIKDSFSKILNKESFDKKNIYLNGIQGQDYTKQQQIQYTFSDKIIHKINELQGEEDEVLQMKIKFRIFKKVNELTLKDIGCHSFEELVESLVKTQIL